MDVINMNKKSKGPSTDPWGTPCCMTWVPTQHNLKILVAFYYSDKIWTINMAHYEDHSVLIFVR